MVFLCYSKCSTCIKAKKWLNDNSLNYEERPIKENNPSIEELKLWHEISGLPLKKFFNTSGVLYKEMNLKETLKNMDYDKQFGLLASDGMLVKRPILIGDNFVLVGFNESEWAKVLL